MILLTGATGYIGSAIARELVSNGDPFRVLVRDPARLDFDAVGTRCEVVVGDLRDPKALARALQGAGRVIHTAALVKTWVRDRREFRRVNVEGLKLLCRIAAEARVERIIYTSSFIALGPSSDGNAREGLQHRGPCANEYEQTKVEALEWLRQEGFRQFPVAALLPGVVYGRGPQTEGNLVGTMIRQYCARGPAILLGSGRQRWSFAHNRDVALAHVAALEKAVPGQEYILGGDNRSLNDFYRALARVSGVQRTMVHVPFAVGKAVGAAQVARARLTGHPPTLTPGVVEILKHDWVYSSEKAACELGYQVTLLEKGLERTLQGS